jgi:hypothetical protein
MQAEMRRRAVVTMKRSSLMSQYLRAVDSWSGSLIASGSLPMPLFTLEMPMVVYIEKLVCGGG